jgi:hypothetical protein
MLIIMLFRLFRNFYFKLLFYVYFLYPNYITNTTSNNGYLGSRNDEDRSEFRYVMRIAELVNHQNVERKLHFL